MPWMRLIGRRLLVLLSVTMLAACETTPATAIDAVPCQALRLVSFSASGDSEQTVREVREQNAVIEELCP